MSLLWNPKSPKQECDEIEENHLEETKSEGENEPQESGENLILIERLKQNKVFQLTLWKIKS